MSRFDALFVTELDRLTAAGLRRAAAVRDARLNFSSNDYLGLSRHPMLAARAAAYAARLGTGAGASRLVCGTLEAHAVIEARVAAMKGHAAAMLLGTGWQANVAVLGALLRFAGSEAKLFCDELNHSSLVHGARIAGVKPVRFRHNDMAHLAELLAAYETAPGRCFIATESVFSMDGDRADLAALRSLAAAHDAFLYVDEAHATGVLGAGGMGLCAHLPGIDLVMGTFSKALGSFGAYVAGSRPLIEFLQNTSATRRWTWCQAWMPNAQDLPRTPTPCAPPSPRSASTPALPARRSFRPWWAMRAPRCSLPPRCVPKASWRWRSAPRRCRPAPAASVSRCPRPTTRRPSQH
jgi:8-amino-7-oxononanoate synthase